MSSVDQLERLCDEYSEAIRLERHKKICETSLRICDQLIKLFDDELIQGDIDEGDEAGQDEANDRSTADIVNSNEWQLVDLICHRLRRQSILAQANEAVLKFVREQDSVCLDKLVNRQITNDKVLDYHTCARVLRQSILLLKELQARSAPEKFPSPDWLPISSITCLKTVSFPRYIIDLNCASEERPSQEDTGPSIDCLLERCIEQALGASDSHESSEGNESVFYKLISCPWFRNTIEESQSKRFYGYDKFSILIAIWIVASECQHGEMEHLLNELVSQMFHQETNSCNLDEFLLLTQAGAVWLSYKKRVLASVQHLGFRNVLAATDEEPDEVYKESPPHRRAISSSDSSSSGSSASGSIRRDSPLDEATRGSSLERDLLRAIIDDELLIGRKCILCDRKPSGQLMEPVQMLQCAGCAPQLKPADLHLNHCHCSFQPLDWLLPLDSLKTRLKLVGLKRLLVLTPNEWVQRALEACSQLLGPRLTLLTGEAETEARSTSASQHDGSEIGERVQICDKFERLTVLRRPASEQGSESSDEHADDDSNHYSNPKGAHLGLEDEDEFADFSEGEEPSGLERPGAVDGELTGAESVCLANLEALFRWRYGRVVALGREAALPAALRFESESLQAAKRASGQCEQLAANSADLIAIDSLDNSIRLALLAGQPSKRPAPARAGTRDRERAQQVADDSILGCLARSQTSQLPLGCARFFLRSALLIGAPHQTARSGAAAKAALGANGCAMALNERANELCGPFAAVECPACGQQLVQLGAVNLARFAAQ